MEDGDGRCSRGALLKDEMEGAARVSFEKASSQGTVGGGHHEKGTNQNQMTGGLLEKEQSEDIDWLSSLSHSQLDLLISLKELAILRAKNAGYEDIAEKFDLRMLRALGAILMEYLKERIKNASMFSDSEGFELLSGTWYAAKKHGKNSCQMRITENNKASSLPMRKRLLEGETGSQSCKRQKVEDSSG